jgi:hypothetical protein
MCTLLNFVTSNAHRQELEGKMEIVSMVGLERKILL